MKKVFVVLEPEEIVRLQGILPIRQAITNFGDKGQVEMLDEGPLSEVVARFEQLQPKVVQ
jgi:hypothetical protein